MVKVRCGSSGVGLCSIAFPKTSYLRLVFLKKEDEPLSRREQRLVHQGKADSEGFESAVLKTKLIIRHNLIKDYAFFITTIISQNRGVSTDGLPLKSLQGDAVSQLRSASHG